MRILLKASTTAGMVGKNERWFPNNLTSKLAAEYQRFFDFKAFLSFQPPS